MQTSIKAIAFVLALGVFSGCHSRKRQSFEEAIVRYRNTLVDQVNEVGKGLPFFSPETLNPTWKEDNIVRIPSLELLDQDGKTIKESLFQGKITFVAFIFTSCNGFCPFLIQGLKKVETALKSYSNIQYVAFSVDPEQDTPSRLKTYAKKFNLAVNKNWKLLTGNHDTIYSLAKDTFASQAFKKTTPGPRNFAHSEHFYVIDPQGRLRSVLNGTRLDTPQHAQVVIQQMNALNNM